MKFKIDFWLIILIAIIVNTGPHKHSRGAQVKGYIHDKANKPLSQAEVRLYDCDARSSICEKVLRSTRSDANGSFILKADGVKPGLYTLEAHLFPSYLPRARVPVMIPDDEGKTLDFEMLLDRRNAAGLLVGVPIEDAKEIYIAAKLEQNSQLEVLSKQILNDNQKEHMPYYAAITDGPRVEGVGPNWAIIAWTTNTGGSSVVRYGTDANSLTQTAEAPYSDNEKSKAQNHRVHINNLKPNTKYYFIADSAQGEGTGTEVKSPLRVFTTKSKE